LPWQSRPPFGAYPTYQAYDRWKAAEADLKAIGLPDRIEGLTADEAAKLAAVLAKCSQPGFDPEAVP
jgi:hypothetical protein